MNDGHITLGYMLMHMVSCHQIMHEARKLKGIMYFKWSQLELMKESSNLAMMINTVTELVWFQLIT